MSGWNQPLVQQEPGDGFGGFFWRRRKRHVRRIERDPLQFRAWAAPGCSENSVACSLYYQHRNTGARWVVCRGVGEVLAETGAHHGAGCFAHGNGEQLGTGPARAE